MALADPAFHLFFARISRRSWLEPAEREALAALPAQARQIETNRDFVRLGERTSHACLVADGLVGRFGQNRDGNRQMTALHIPGDIADLHSVVVPEAGSALQALCVSTVLMVPHAALREVAARYPAVAEAFWRESVVDASVLAEWIVNVARRQALPRMAHLLCEMACRYGKGGEGPALDFIFPATQTHMADMCGLTPVHVNRTLMALRGQQLIRTEGRRVIICQWDSLARLGDFEPDYLHLKRPVNDTGRLIAVA